ncbi:MAG: hypothetical protein FJ276_00235 [Planctomycetes bacterium]|nr:hypothetical protein [Planctomycetota bacterium]
MRQSGTGNPRAGNAEFPQLRELDQQGHRIIPHGGLGEVEFPQVGEFVEACQARGADGQVVEHEGFEAGKPRDRGKAFVVDGRGSLLAAQQRQADRQARHHQQTLHERFSQNTTRGAAANSRRIHRKATGPDSPRQLSYSPVAGTSRQTR